jgi:hypothetical protein
VLLDVPLHIRRELWLQKDGAPPHFGRHVTAFLNQRFQSRWIGRQGPTPRPPRSPDLTPLDYYLQGRVKSLVYVVKSSTVAELLNRKMDASAHIRKDKPFVMRSVTSI